jgi:hypothetical protein
VALGSLKLKEFDTLCGSTFWGAGNSEFETHWGSKHCGAQHSSEMETNELKCQGELEMETLGHWKPQVWNSLRIQTLWSSKLFGDENKGIESLGRIGNGNSGELKTLGSLKLSGDPNSPGESFKLTVSSSQDCGSPKSFKLTEFPAPQSVHLQFSLEFQVISCHPQRMLSSAEFGSSESFKTQVSKPSQSPSLILPSVSIY